MPILFSLLYTLPDHNVSSQKCEKKSDYLKRLYVTTFWQSNTKPVLSILFSPTNHELFRQYDLQALIKYTKTKKN